MMHVGWSSPTTAEYYLKLANVIKAGVPADLLTQDSPSVAEAADIYSRYDSSILVKHLLPKNVPYPSNRRFSFRMG